ncbi:MAG: LCP family protein [Patescibacteria group bacterium]
MPTKDIQKGKTQPAISPTPETAKVPEPLHPKKRFHWWHAVVGVFAVIAIVAIGLGWKILTVGSSVFSGTNGTSTLGQLGKLIVPGDRELKNDGNGRTNILLVGHGGPGHEGPYLADTIILASIDQRTSDVAMLSIPRDFLVELPNYGYRKINNALAFGRTDEKPEGGDALITQAVQDVTGQTVHYFTRVDFNGFKEAVDTLGKLNVNVETPFVDAEYPTYNFGYQTIRFESGEQKMDGERALQFSRSRHGNNGQGSDFARSARQQKLLFAFREKALSVGTLTNPAKISGLLDDLGSHVHTTFELWEVARLAHIAKELTPEKVVSRVLETTPDNLVRQGTGTDGAYVIQPRLGLGNYAEIHELEKNIFQLNAVAKEKVAIQVQNATGETGLADMVGKTLRGFAYDIVSIGTPKGVRYEQSVVVDLSNGQAPQTVASLQSKYGATITTTVPADITLATSKPLANLNTNTPTNPQIILILGTSAVTIVNSATLPAARNLPASSST